MGAFLVASGCSFAFVSSEPLRTRSQPCASRVAPTVDVAGALVFVGAGIGRHEFEKATDDNACDGPCYTGVHPHALLSFAIAAAYVASGITGYVRVSACQQALAAPPPPHVLPPPTPSP